MTNPPSSIRIRTGSRLHFGLLDTAMPFGGCGIMIDGLGVDVHATPQQHFFVDDQHRDRGKAIADRIRDHFGLPHRPACRIEVRASPPAHSGMGSGTQLSLAITECLVRATGHVADRDTLIRLSDRGRRSAVGIHGYFDGGFIAEGCEPQKSEAKSFSINPISHRIEFPDDWRVAVLLPRIIPTPVAGDTEHSHFSKLSPATVEYRSGLVSMLIDQIIPAAMHANFADFADPLEDYNRRSGELFRAVQGGPYNGKIATDLVELAKRHGGRGTGQSSWGPGVFTWFETPDKADDFVARVAASNCECHLLKPRHRPRDLD